MKTFYFTFSFFLFFSLASYSQAPFTTLAAEPIYVKKDKDKYMKFDIEKYIDSIKVKEKEEKKDDEAYVFNANTYVDSLLEEDDIEKTEAKEDVDFFKNNSLALSVLSSGDNRMSVNSQVVFYKINIFTPIDKVAKYRYNIPMMIIAKLSTSYDSISGSNAIDVLDYEAAPVTLRIMPSFKISNNKTYKEKLLFGFYADVRGLNFHNTETNDYSIKVVGSGGIGFSFQGDGEAGFYNKEGEYEKGNWILSLIMQGAVGKKEIIQSLFNTEKDFVTSFQSYFMFKIAENNKFNLKVGFHHFFQETIAGTKNNFSIAIGM